MSRIRLVIQGTVQGVGFRPFVYRLASELELKGWVNNSAQGVTIEAEGKRDRLDRFIQRIEAEKPPHSTIQTIQRQWLDPAGDSLFEIRFSREDGKKTALILPDLAVCGDCVEEILDPANRRYLYPFTNCTHCGPRFSIINALPYDRANTSMQSFTMCSRCQYEYDNPTDRRFHAQPNACPDCGPCIELWDERGKVLSQRHTAIEESANAVRDGRIVAVKGVGGFHLVVDARSTQAIARLRNRKHREEKPFAVMFPGIETIKECCRVSSLEETILGSPQSPIVLLKRNPQTQVIANEVAPGNPCLGAMRPYTPLHLILMRELEFPIVATSGNRSDEPICIDEREALRRLSGIADLFLVHNRPIVRHVDDSVVRVLNGRETILRRARGYAPLPVSLPKPIAPALAVGGHLKNTIALNAGSNIFISQHIGDLETEESYRAFTEVIDRFQRVYETKPESIACDLHPDYLSTKYAERSGIPVRPIQHHHAHIVSCMADNLMDGQVLGVAWDGTGYGTDGTIWGGEFLLATLGHFKRVAHFRTFPLPSGEGAVKKLCRTALGLLYECLGEDVFKRTDLPFLHEFSPSDLKVMRDILSKKINAPYTSSAGRLFDAVASLTGLRQTVSFEGQAAMELEFSIREKTGDEYYPYTINDWEPMVRAILHDTGQSVSVAGIALRYHNTLVEIIVEIAKRIGEKRVVLSGGCFQNAYLTERAIRRLREEGFSVYWHRQVPPNDGGIALGQIVAAHYRGE